MLFSYYDRVIKEGLYICENCATIRETAKVFGVSKSCVHKDIHSKLKYVDYPLYVMVAKVLKENFAQKHIRGGIATRKKFEKAKNKIKSFE